MLRSKMTSGHLAIDLGREQHGVQGAFMLSTAVGQ
jgi:hypothetical protein